MGSSNCSNKTLLGQICNVIVIICGQILTHMITTWVLVMRKTTWRSLEARYAGPSADMAAMSGTFPHRLQCQDVPNITALPPAANAAIRTAHIISAPANSLGSHICGEGAPYR